jgi:hypothetical protein
MLKSKLKEFLKLLFIKEKSDFPELDKLPNKDSSNPALAEEKGTARSRGPHRDHRRSRGL